MSLRFENVYQYEFPTLEGYLHHRAPYLLLNSLVEITDDRCVTTASVADLAEILAGHFPGAPILPGALMQEMTTQTAGVLIAGRHNPMSDYRTDDPHHNEFALGVLVRVRAARYRGFARPGDQLRISVKLEERVDQLFDFTGEVTCRESLILRNKFQLANIPTRTLIG
jgi:3-hydroxyacyl-[acyl-carrier-protein] dehydratase